MPYNHNHSRGTRIKTDSFYLHAKKSLGQNFLADDSIVQHIVQTACDFLLSKNKTHAHLLEIGPGTGRLTKALLNIQSVHCSVTAIEKDHRAIKGLQDTLAKQHPTQFILHDADILKFSPTHFDLCVGNIPYYITSDILMWLCRHKDKFFGTLLMVQDEVADRLCAHTNTKEYSRLTIKMQLNFKITKLFQVSKECFVPSPKVNSAVISLVPNTFSFSTQKEEQDFETFTARLFSQRRKMLRRIFAEDLKHISLEKAEEFWKALSKIGISQTDRPESISPEHMLKLFHQYRLFVT